MSRPAVAIIGAGKVGSTLGILLRERGYPVAGVYSRTPSSARALAERLGTQAPENPVTVTRAADLVLVTTPDGAIGPVAARLAEAGGFRPGQVVAHASGALSSEVLAPARGLGAAVVSIHPLQTFAEVEGAVQHLPGSFFAVEGDEAALPVARQMVEDLGGRYFLIRAEDKPLYHAAACIACNYLVALLHLATGLYRRFGLKREQAFEALQPLVAGTFRNIARVGVAAALTGPIARGDAETVARHLEVLEPLGGEVADLYRRLGAYTVGVALEKGSIGDREAALLHEILGSRAMDGDETRP
ncbi:MAG: DUF2520 domain-containing protein [Firmicutes bacterium]|nr:DUF2520 domain-containing protein [Bacillota bacterium]